MKSLIHILSAVSILMTSRVNAGNETKTLISGDAATSVLSLGDGESAKLMFAHDTNTNTGSTTAFNIVLSVVKAGKTLSIPASTGTSSGTAPTAPVEIAGPATVTLGGNQTPLRPNIATFSVTRVGTYSEPVCIPIEAGSTFQVILESSSDLVNWTPANPGSYSGTEAKRFFRTRIIKQ